MNRLGPGLGGAIRLIRPVNCLLTMGSVVVGALTAHVPAWRQDVAIAAIAAALITGAGNAINDLRDIEEDRINRPDRPLPSGDISTTTAWLMALLLVLIGLSLAWWVSNVTGGIATAVAVGLVAYSWGLKRQGPAGNLLVATMAAGTFPYGALTGGDLGRSWIPALFALIYHLGREIVKGMEDQAGDERRGIRTIALRWGSVVAGRAAAACLSVVGLLALIPWIAGLYGIAYGLPVLVLIALLGGWIRQLLTEHEPAPPGRHAGRLSRRLLLGMVLGLLAICLGELTIPPDTPASSAESVK